VRVTVMHHPGAGPGSHDRAALEAAVAGAGHRTTYHSVEDDGWRAALAEPADLVAVAGGDGTVARVLIEAAGRGVPVAVIPLGSANNIARSLGYPGGEPDPAAAAGRWERAPRRPFDIGLLEGPGPSEPVIESAGGGLLAELLRRAREPGPPVSGAAKLRRGRALLADALAEAPLLPWRIDLDGRDLSGRYLAVEALNIGTVGANVRLAPTADPGDGLLDLVLAGEDERRLVLGGVPLPAHRGRILRMEPPEGCPLHVDDDLWPTDAGRAPDGELRVTAAVRRAEVLGALVW
jgi:diacylglycerol kinase (ATP)